MSCNDSGVAEPELAAVSILGDTVTEVSSSAAPVHTAHTVRTLARALNVELAAWAPLPGKSRGATVTLVDGTHAVLRWTNDAAWNRNLGSAVAAADALAAFGYPAQTIGVRFHQALLGVAPHPATRRAGDRRAVRWCSA